MAMEEDLKIRAFGLPTISIGDEGFATVRLEFTGEAEGGRIEDITVTVAVVSERLAPIPELWAAARPRVLQRLEEAMALVVAAQSPPFPVLGPPETTEQMLARLEGNRLDGS